MLDTDAINDLLNPAAQNAARMFAPYASADDILNDLWVYVLENQAYVKSCINDTEESGLKKLRTAISTQARASGQKYKAQAGGYSVDDVMRYSTRALEALLPDVFDHEDWQSFGQHGDGQPTAKTPAHMTGDRTAELVDISLALRAIKERSYNVLVWRYKYNLTQEAVAAELELTQTGAHRAIKAALKALQKQLGPKAQDDGETLSDGPGTRRVMSNAAWRANTSKSWDGE